MISDSFNIRLSADQIRKNLSSYVDPNGYVFEYNGAVFRAIRKERSNFYRDLFVKGDIERLVSSCHVVSSSIADIEIDDTSIGLIIQHEKVEPITYCVEWCPEMLRDAAETTLNLLQQILEKDMTLQDANPWNILFKGTTPVFVDLTSIVPIDTSLLWPAYDQFQSFFMRPLLLAGQQKGNVAMALLMNNSIQGISLHDYYLNSNCLIKLKNPLLYFKVAFDRFIQKHGDIKKNIRAVVQKRHIAVSRNMRAHFYKSLRKRLDSFRFNTNTDVWTEYYKCIPPEVDKNAKLKTVNGILTRLRPASVLDLGCNTGVFSASAADSGARVIAIDSSEDCINRLYALAKEKKMNITPLISDVICMTPAFGFMGIQYPSLPERSRSELVLCLGLMHHLHITDRQSFDRIASLLNSLSDRHLIFEFVALDDSNNDLLGAGRVINYSFDGVAGELKKYFPEIEIFESDRPTRKILLCSKNRT